jgi:predicted permease
MRWLKALFRKSGLDRDLDDELRFHLDAEIEANLRSGMTPQEARRQALLTLGGVEQVKERTREVRPGFFLETLWQDVRFGARMLRKNPGFTAVAVLTLALGIGANSAVFSLLDAVMLRSLPVERPEELVLLQFQFRGELDPSFNYPLFEDYRDTNTVFSGLVAYNPVAMHATIGRESERIIGLQVSWNFFDVVGARPVVGRGFLAEEDRLGAPAQVAVISYGLWEDRFEGRADAVGREILINGQRFTIVGVAPPRFTGVMRGQFSEIYTPVTTPLDALANPGRWYQRLTNRGYTWLQMLGRLKPGVTREQAQAAMRTLAEQVKKVQPMNTHTELVVSEGRLGFTGFVTNLEGPLRLLQWIVALVLAIACANVTNLQLTRALARRKEVAVRRALGAGAGRLLRQLLTESILLAAAGGLAGLLVARWLVDLLRSFQPDLRVVTALDVRVLAVTLAVALFVGVLFGLAPAWQAARVGVMQSLKEDPRAGRGRRWNLRSALVVTQIGLSLVVLVAAGLAVKSLRGFLAIEPGFETDRVTLFSLDVVRSGYAEERGRQFYAQLLEAVRATPGVEAAGMCVAPPLTGGGMRHTSVPEGRTYDREHPINLSLNIVSPDYFRAMGIPLLRGRDFSAQDRSGAPFTAIVNEALVREYWPGHDGLGKTIDLMGDPVQRTHVVGVVADSKFRRLTEPTIPTVYLPFEQYYEGRLMLMARSNRPSAIVGPVREIVRALDPTIPVTGIRTLAEQRLRSLSTPRMAATLLSMLGSLGLLLGTLGLYGVMAWGVAQRTHEIGIRMALGAPAAEILRLVIRQGLKLLALGLGLGLAAVWGAAKTIGSLFNNVSPRDPWTLAGVTLLLSVAALVACWLPARRAARVDPMVALRYE